MNHLDQERLLDLLAERAISGLNADQQRELAQLQEQFPEIDDQYFDLPAAAAALAWEGEAMEPLPEDLRQRIQTQSERYFPVVFQAPAVMPVRRNPVVAWGGWLAAAACLALAVYAWRPVPDRAPGQSVEQKIAQDPARGRWDWESTKDPAGAGAKGEVVWSQSQQMGLMKFEGLAPNQPGETAYQLWIFDGERDQRYPVDGGVFTVAPGQRSVTVPIQAKLPVKKPVMFAVTVEKPGGVVVSSRERIAVLAKVI